MATRWHFVTLEEICEQAKCKLSKYALLVNKPRLSQERCWAPLHRHSDSREVLRLVQLATICSVLEGLCNVQSVYKGVHSLSQSWKTQMSRVPWLSYLEYKKFFSSQLLWWGYPKYETLLPTRQKELVFLILNNILISGVLMFFQEYWDLDISCFFLL